MTRNAPRPALLLLGPTGSGKSPLGRLLERTAGFVHLDFGAELRAIAAGTGGADLARDERATIAALLASNALFPDDALPLVRRIVGGLLAGRPAAGTVVLNGVPRTVAQATGLEPLLDVRRVVALACDPAVVLARVGRRRAGLSSDDAGRTDDTAAEVERKLASFERETRPLVEHYGSRGVSVLTLSVAVDTREEELAAAILAGGGP